MGTIRTFLKQDTGASGAEVAMLTVLGLGILLTVFKQISGGVGVSLTKIVDMLSLKSPG